jgi:hypothetical protein
VYSTLSDETITKMFENGKLTFLVFSYRYQHEKTDRFYDNYASRITTDR